MTDKELRDYFAAKAMQELLAALLRDSKSEDEVAQRFPEIPLHAYMMADMMLSQRKD
jgi:hypothetical protein